MNCRDKGECEGGGDGGGRSYASSRRVTCSAMMWPSGSWGGKRVRGEFNEVLLKGKWWEGHLNVGTHFVYPVNKVMHQSTLQATHQTSHTHHRHTSHLGSSCRSDSCLSSSAALPLFTGATCSALGSAGAAFAWEAALADEGGGRRLGSNL